MTSRLRPNSPPVVHETVAGETVIVELDSGSYYHLAGSGSYLWELLAGGRDTGATADALADHYDLATEDARAAVDALVDELRRERLVVDAVGTEAAAATDPETPSGPYDPPLLTKHDDMQELLVLDPVHEVDETGWPARR